MTRSEKYQSLFLRTAPWFFALLPALLTAHYLRLWLVDAPFMDDYVWLPTYEKIVKGTFQIRDFFFVQMEHRLTVPAFIAWACFHINHGHVVIHNWISFTQIVLTVGNLFFIFRRSSERMRSEWIVFGLCSFLFFSPTQFSTLLWSDCFSSFLPLTFLSSAIALFHSRLRPAFKFVACVACAVLSTHSFASGILIWFLMLPLILWSDFLPDGKPRKIFLASWCAACAYIMATYFIGMVNQAEPAFSYKQGHEETIGKHFNAFISNPEASGKFILIFTGAMLGRGYFADIKTSAMFFGSVLVLAVLGALIYFWFRRSDRSLKQAMTPWLIFAAYSVATGGMVALGRIWASVNLDGALWGRYTTHAAPISFSVCVLGILIIRDVMKRHPALQNPARSIGSAFCGGVIVIIAAGWIYGVQMMEVWWSSRLRDATSQLFSKVLPRVHIQGPVTRNLEMADRFDDIGALHPAMFKTQLLDQVKVMDHKPGGRMAELDGIRFSESDRIEFGGFALLPGHSRVADGVILTRLDDHKRWVFVALAQVNQPPFILNSMMGPDNFFFLHSRFKGIRDIRARFQMKVFLDSFPEGESELTAWTFDYKKQTAWPMAGRFKINTRTREVQKVEEEDEPVKKQPE